MRTSRHKSGAAAAKKERKRDEAEARNEAYQKLPLNQKLARNSAKVRDKIATEPRGEP